MTPPPCLDLKAFIPAKDFAVSMAFYKALGFTLNWEGDGIAEFQVGAYRFLLQNYYQQQWAENCMLHLLVEDVSQWWKQISDTKLVDQFPGTRATEPKMQPWGLIVLYLHDPAGVLWHIAQRPAAGQEASHSQISTGTDLD